MWTQEQRNSFAKEYILTAKSYDKDVGIDLAKMVIEDLQDLDFEKCFHALSKYRNNDANKTWPRQASIRSIVIPSYDKRFLAIELAHKIDRAVNKHGWAWDQGFFGSDGKYWEDEYGNKFSSFKEAVISELGEIGWYSICSRGGWLNVRNSSNDMDQGIFISQMRDQIQATVALRELGFDITKIEMPKPQTQLDNSLKQIGNFLKEITPKGSGGNA